MVKNGRRPDSNNRQHHEGVFEHNVRHRFDRVGLRPSLGNGDPARELHYFNALHRHKAGFSARAGQNERRDRVY